MGIFLGVIVAISLALVAVFIATKAWQDNVATPLAASGIDELPNYAGYMHESVEEVESI